MVRPREGKGKEGRALVHLLQLFVSMALFGSQQKTVSKKRNLKEHELGQKVHGNGTQRTLVVSFSIRVEISVQEISEKVTKCINEI